MNSVFSAEVKQPTDKDLEKALGNTYPLWQEIRDYVMGKDPKASEEWTCSKHGWSVRIKDKKRAIIYLLPRDKFFKVAFVFGGKATDLVLKSKVAESIKAELNTAKVYAEGRGIRIDIQDDTLVRDIMELVDIKLIKS